MTLFQAYVVVAIVVFGALALLAHTTPYFHIDIAITHTLQALRSPGLDALMQAISWPGYNPQLILLIGIVAGLVYAFRLRWEAIMIGLSASSAQLLSDLLKAIIRRPRPPADLVYAFETLSDFGFPSGHVMFYLGFFGFLGFLSYRLLEPSWTRVLLFLIFGTLIGLVGLSRLYLGVHWASDIVGAYLIGSLVLALAIQLYYWGIPHFFSHRSAPHED
jgi:undecaprenyl-diphosphatase